ncbi:MAG: hydroxymethylbilane synthase [Cyclobacteriaceae bacterium]|nr:hydroxymethylbilane synthase [Cyclobacteriaceae bacterium]MDH4296528.1 hydroxymethylbilane synthase [Cyclobacteriaceae bacterium]MDH5248793.1 hydroxymethylbilane synthase [Cyclobacteriaceae bacterium]
MNKIIRIGTRGSKLALWQAEHVAGLIRPSGYQTEIVPVETRGDKILDVTISKIGSKGVFTEEIEAKLLDGSIDIAVHSAKDLSSEIPDELELIGFTARELANDVIVSTKKNINPSKDKLKIGTSATRRVAFLRHFYPNLEAVTIRGNLQTRFAKLQAGEYDALLLAYAGVRRMGFDHLIVEKIETSYFVPAVGQGSIAIECHKKLSFQKKEIISNWVNHPETEGCIRAERAFLRGMQGGCSIPVFGYAQFDGALITLKGGIISLDGQRIVKAKRTAPPEDVKELGESVAHEVLSSGGKEILKEIRNLAMDSVTNQ